jgi:sulfate adenylyltransferase
LELLTSGAFAPLRGFLDAADAAWSAERGVLADGTPWPVPVTLEVPAGAVPADAEQLVLQDLEGSPLAVLAITERATLASSGPAMVRLAGPVTALRQPEHGPFRALRRRPADVRAELAGGNVLAYATRRPLNKRHIGQLRHFAGQLNARLLVLPLVTGPAAVVTRPEALVRTVLAAGQNLPAGTLVIPVPLGPRHAGPDADLQAQAIVAAAYGATHLLADVPEVAGTAGSKNGTLTLPGMPIPVISAGEWAYDPRSEVWRPLALIEPGAERSELIDAELAALLDSGADVPAWFAPPEVIRELRRARPPRAERGLVIFFTGLSGSGKSTVARGLAETLTERGDRTVSLLDGDQVRHLLSAGLSFSRADRDLNLADREMVTKVGDFLLVHVSTPVEVCEARDRKGLYAKARAGLITGFTGVSDPYQEPRDADLVLDTSTMTRQQAIDAVLKLLLTGGWLADEAAAAAEPNGAGTGRAGGSMLRLGPAVRRL